MTALGKILVFINLAFSLLVSGLIVFVFTASTNWRNAYTKMESNYKIRDAALMATEKELDDFRNKYNADTENLRRAREAVDRELAQIKQQLQAEKDRATTLSAGEQAQRTNTQVLTAELERVKKEREQLGEQITAREQKINELQAMTNKFRTESVSNKIAFDSELERNRNLLSQLEQVTRQNTALKQQLGTSGVPNAPTATQAPPPEDLRGTVVAVDGRAGIATISVGSDAGVANGHTLFVFRTTPEPTYLGDLRITNVTARQAVGRFTPAATGRRTPVREGDVVAATIVGVGGR